MYQIRRVVTVLVAITGRPSPHCLNVRVDVHSRLPLAQRMVNESCEVG